MTGSTIKNRIFIFAAFITIFFLTLIIYLFNLQIIKGLEYKKETQNLASREIPIPTHRGEIYDRNYDIPLVLNVDTYAVDLVPDRVPQDQINELFEQLAELLQIDVDDIHNKIPPSKYNSVIPVELKIDVPFKTISYIAEHSEEFPGCIWSTKEKRVYSETDSFSHIIGYIGEISKDDYQRLFNIGYKLGSILGKSGIEKYYDLDLRGKEGTRLRIVDAKGNKILEKEEKEFAPELGKDIILTIDRHVQKLCEKQLGQRKGAVIVLRPTTGEILAMVSYPAFDPNKFYTKEGQSYFNKLSLDPEFPFINRALNEYPPASTFKIVMTSAILELGTFPVDKTITCTGKNFYGDRTFHCWLRSGHGPQNLLQAFSNSCNSYFFNVGRDYIGIDNIARYAEKYGLGVQTAIDISNEHTGLIPTPEWKEYKYDTKWLGGDTMNVSIGQGFITATPLQVANVVAMVVNKGKIYQPSLVKQMRDHLTGDILYTAKKKILKESDIKEETFIFIQKAMRKVVESGTAKNFITTKAVQIAGKTGTSETGLNIKQDIHEWFVAYAPYNAENIEKTIVVVVFLESANQNEFWAPKATNNIMHEIFTNKEYEHIFSDIKL